MAQAVPGALPGVDGGRAGRLPVERGTGVAGVTSKA
ncbi:hypothetical protein FHU37_003962 [Allostreptomyces psammosilenae]|uniref:Uncharacterized protein n=1 Tax=Allostreptomyces psammosilenae TaxID=1892865 RepID=A0A852ZXV9_9ACTN|nr:hypothetical protein [Allostreptomyces psammosilenae]